MFLQFHRPEQSLISWPHRPNVPCGVLSLLAFAREVFRGALGAVVGALVAGGGGVVTHARDVCVIVVLEERTDRACARDARADFTLVAFGVASIAAILA